MFIRQACHIVLVVIMVLLLTTPLPAEEAKSMDKAELAKASQNPVANMVKIPIQINVNDNYGSDRNKTQIVANIFPVIPISPNKDRNLINHSHCHTHHLCRIPQVPDRTRRRSVRRPSVAGLPG